MNPKSLAEKMHEIKDRQSRRLGSDIELDHSEADGIIILTLRELGYEEAMDIYESIDKWYA